MSERDRRSIMLLRTVLGAVIEHPQKMSAKEQAIFAFAFGIGTHLETDIGHAILAEEFSDNLHMMANLAAEALVEAGYELGEGEDEEDTPRVKLRLLPPPGDGERLN